MRFEDDMARKIWFTADQHFGHKNIIEYSNRPFESVEAMDNALINAWNERVGETDIIYHLGDFTLQGTNIAARYLERLNGNIHILPGSHDQHWFDKRTYISLSGRSVKFQDPLISLEYKRAGKTYPLVVVLCHYAMRTWDRSHYGSLHLYGHSHGKLPSEGKSMDVGVDNISGYRPISLREIADVLLDLPDEATRSDKSKGE